MGRWRERESTIFRARASGFTQRMRQVERERCYSPRMFTWIPGGKGGRVIAIAVAAGLSTGFLLVPRTSSPDDPKLPLPEVVLLRQKLPAGDGAQKQALERVRR